MSVWDEIRELAGKALVATKGDIRGVYLLIPVEKEAEMLKPPDWETTDLKTKVAYVGVRDYYDQMYGMLMVYGAPTFGWKRFKELNEEEKRLVEDTYAAYKAARDQAKKVALQTQYLEALARQQIGGNGNEAQKGNPIITS